MNDQSLSPVYPYGAAPCRGQIKQCAEDFRVVEQLGFELSGAGEHLFLYLEKTGLTTQDVINQLADQLGVPARQIGYSGLKDKHAVTRQWISVQLPGCKQIPEITQTPQLRLLESGWHDKKLRVGVHKSNCFEIVIRNVAGDCDQVSRVIDSVKATGFANYFGEQRFGTQQDNVAQAIRVLSNRHKSKRLTRHKKSLYLSALRSELFNQILAKRIALGIWQQPVEGDAYLLAGSQSVFSEALTEAIIQRYKELDIHCGISLFGSGESRLTAQALAIEDELFAAHSDITDALLGHELKRSLRANRACVKDLQFEYRPEQAEIHLKVELEKGVYLTTMLNHFIQTSVN